MVLPLTYTALAGWSVIGLFVYTATYMIYNAYFHPLAKFPGPKWWAASFLPNTIQSLKGRLPYAVKELHDQYGQVVRLGPNTLSYDSAEAWEDICGHIKGTHTKTFEKDYDFYGPTVSGAPNIIVAHEADHRRMRRMQSHAFSDRALAQQEGFLQKHLHNLVRALEKLTSEGPAIVPIMQYYNFATFDLIGDLAFGHSFGCLDSGKMHPWVAITFDFIKMMEYMRCTRIFPTIEKLLALVIPASLKKIRVDHAQFSVDRVKERLQMNTDRKDFLSYIIDQKGEKNMTQDELNENAGILVLAGSETTATVLTGATYHLLRNPKVYAKLKEEVRTSFKSPDEITISSIANLPYLNACIEEGLRIFPPAPVALPRKSPGANVCGEFVPEGTIVGVCGWAVSHSARNFYKPDEYHPERWLNDPAFANDNKRAAQAFSYGPRNCIGKNLAWAEMRLILTNLMWHFEMELPEADKDWLARNQIFMLWEKVEFHVRLSRRVHEST